MRSPQAWIRFVIAKFFYARELVQRAFYCIFEQNRIPRKETSWQREKSGTNTYQERPCPKTQVLRTAII